MKMRAQVRVAWAIGLLVCLVAILLMPGMTSVVRSHATGKHMVRLLSVHSLLTLASASAYRGTLRASELRLSNLWRVVRGSGPDLLRQTCVLRC